MLPVQSRTPRPDSTGFILQEEKEHLVVNVPGIRPGADDPNLRADAKHATIPPLEILKEKK
jgi:hypothetical protein